MYNICKSSKRNPHMDFDNFNWEKTSANWEKWWNGSLGRPLFYVTDDSAINPDDVRPADRFISKVDFSIPAKKVLEGIEERILRKRQYLGDAFPFFWPNFGPGVLAAFCGGQGVNHDETVWFYPGKFENAEIKDISINLDKNAIWFKRLEEFFHAAAEIWKDKVTFGMTDLGGTLDVISTFRPSEKLLFDLYDSPDEVKRLSWEVHAAWWQAYEHFENIIKGQTREYSAWTSLLSSKRYYMLQCDFSYMISPEMFEEFVKPELEASCKKLENAFYHLDGKGEIPHLPHLFSIKELAGIQWIPGDGMPQASEWPDLLKQIIDSGRKLQVYVQEIAQVEKILACTDNPEAIVFIGGFAAKEQNKLKEIFKRFDV